MALSTLLLATLSDWADIAGIAGAVLAVVGLALVVVQLRGTEAAARAQATIQFQGAFRQSKDARGRLLREFPIHEDLVPFLATGTDQGDVRTWRDIGDLSEDERDVAEAVIGALNDVAQYVADGLSLRSALQQYHTIFVRTGALLYPYIEQRNKPVTGPDGVKHRPSRFGRRVIVLYNAGLSYHRRNDKHRGTELMLQRPALTGPDNARLMLIDGQGAGLRERPGFDDDPPPLWRNVDSLGALIRDAERQLRS